MSFREKTAWISLLSMSGIYGFYFWSVFQSGRHPGGFQIGSLLETIVALVVVQVVLIAAVAIYKPSEAKAPRDERDKLISLRAAHFAYSGPATAVAMACLFGALNPPIIFNTNALLFVLVTCEIMRAASQVIQYRRGS